MVHKLWMFHIYVNDSRVSIFNGWSSLIIQMTIKVIMTSQTCGSVHRSYLSHHCHVGPGKKHQLDHQPYCSNWCVLPYVYQCLPLTTWLISCSCYLVVVVVVVVVAGRYLGWTPPPSDALILSSPCSAASTSSLAMPTCHGGSPVKH